MPLVSSKVDASEAGPKVRCVRVFFACSTLSSVREVVMRNQPGRSVSDQLSSGWWLNCQASGKSRSPSARSKSSLATMPLAPDLPCSPTGMSSVIGTLPSSPKTGQPSSQVTGTRYGMRPTAPRSPKSMAYHSPSGVSTRPPWAMPASCNATRPSHGPSRLSARWTSTVRMPPRGQAMFMR